MGRVPSSELPLRVAILSAVDPAANPYTHLLRDAVNRLPGVMARGYAVPTPDIWAWADVVHLHWLEHWDRPPFLAFDGWRKGRNPVRQRVGRALVRLANHRQVWALRRASRLAALFGALSRFRRRGGRTVYTVHNLSGHDDQETWAEAGGMRRMLRQADALHVHDDDTAARVAAIRRRTQGIVTIPHANYVGVYPDTTDRQAARRALGIAPDAFVYLFLGQARPYKGLEDLLPAFRQVARAGDMLLVAGQPAPSGFAATLRQMAEGDARVRLDMGFVAGERIQEYAHAADIGVLPYRRITTSGSAMLLFSFGLPVIAPQMGGFPALVDAARGLLYDPRQSGALAAALRQATATDWQARRPAILEWVRQYDWATVGPQFVALYRDRVGRDAGRA